MAKAKPAKRVRAASSAPAAPAPSAQTSAPEAAIRVTAGLKAQVRSQVRSMAGRLHKSALRRDAILAAALEEFSARGYAAARLEDVAQRAGVGKGTIYLHFHDKEALFRELVTTLLVPFVANIEAAPPVGLPIRLVLERLIDLFVREIYGTERRKLIRLIMTEGPRFPQLAEFHYNHVVKRALAGMRALLDAAWRRGELRNDALVRFPQLVVAPGLMAIVWSGLFDRFAPLDVAAMMRAHLDLILGPGEAS